MRKIFDLGKVHYNGRGKNNPVTIEMELRKRGGENIIGTNEKTPEYVELTICGNIWNSKKSDIYCGGQCLDEIKKYMKDMSPQNQELFKKLYKLWKKYHLNGMHAGTPEQEQAVNEWLAQGNRYDYKAVKDMLIDKGLLIVNYTGKTVAREYHDELYCYGYGWVVQDIPAATLKHIVNLMK